MMLQALCPEVTSAAEEVLPQTIVEPQAVEPTTEGHASGSPVSGVLLLFHSEPCVVPNQFSSTCFGSQMGFSLLLYTHIKSKQLLSQKKFKKF